VGTKLYNLGPMVAVGRTLVHGSASTVREELTRQHGRFALVIGPGAENLVASMAAVYEATHCLVGRALTQGDGPPEDPAPTLGAEEFLINLDILFAPQFRIDPMNLLSSLARRRPVVAAWPGRIDGNEAFYSEPGRRDYYRRRLENVLVIRPKPQVLSGPAEFDIERFQ
jgi:hypothetical protein